MRCSGQRRRGRLSMRVLLTLASLSWLLLVLLALVQLAGSALLFGYSLASDGLVQGIVSPTHLLGWVGGTWSACRWLC